MTDLNGDVVDPAKAAVDLDTAKEALRKARAEADTAEITATKARREEVSALVPDFNKVTPGSLTTSSEGKPAAGTGVASQALKRAGMAIGTSFVAATKGNRVVLVTTEIDLVTSDGVYVNVHAELARLERQASEALADALSFSQLTQDPRGPGHVASLYGPAVGGAIAAAVPGILSLFSARRTVTSGTDTVDDFAAAAVTAGALRRKAPLTRVIHDDMRLVATPKVGGLLDRLSRLQEQRSALEGRKRTLDAMSATGGNPEPTAELALVTTSAAEIDAFLQAIAAAPAGTRSPLTIALLREGLHDHTFTHVLAVKAHSASSMQVVNDKPLWFKDTFAVVGVASITWMLLDASSGDVIDAGIATETAQANGKIGSTFTLE